MRQYRRRRIRLPLERYAEEGSLWHLTMTAGMRQAVLTEPALAAELIASLRTACGNASAPLLLFCLMPDHLHALIQISETDLISILRNYKSFTTKVWWKHGGSGKLWQRSGYDRGVRTYEHVDDVVSYLFKNPAALSEIDRWIDLGLMGGTLMEEDDRGVRR